MPVPELFGVHRNAEITTNQNITLDLCSTLLSIQSMEGGSTGRTEEEILNEISADILKKVPIPWDADDVLKA